MEDCYEWFIDTCKKNKSTNRKIAGKKQMVKSCIFGYYNKPIMSEKKHFKNGGNILICRRCKINTWPDYIQNLLEELTRKYKELDPIEYRLQEEEYDKIDSRFKIQNTIFTTCTVNHNFQTLPHTDKGNFRGRSIILVLGNFTGGELHVGDELFNLKDRDIMLLDGNKIHYNEPIIGERISLVCYIRENMSNCKEEYIVKNKLCLI